MLDFHIHRRILSVLEDMQENLSSHTHAKERRSPEEYLQAIKEIGAVLDTLSTARQKCYAGLLAEPKATLEKAIRKGQPLGKKPRETCQSSLAKLHEELKAEKEVKKGIVFLPYLAAMWDSMESVWQAAERDIPEAALFYHETRHRETVTIDERLRQLTYELSEAMHKTFTNGIQISLSSITATKTFPCQAAWKNTISPAS